MRSLTGREDRRAARVVHLPQAVDINSRRVDHRPGHDLERLGAFGVFRTHSGDPAAMLDKPRDRHIIQSSSTEVNDRPGQGDRQSRIVELTVGIDDPAVQPFGADRGEAGRRPRCGRRNAIFQADAGPRANRRASVRFRRKADRASDRPARRSHAGKRDGKHCAARPCAFSSASRTRVMLPWAR